MIRPRRHARPSTIQGFTVLELIVALTLGLVLLSAVWTMFRLFLRHQEIETAQIEKVQLVSSLHQHLSQELLNLFPGGKSGPASSTAPAAPLPRTNLPLPGTPAPAFPLMLPNQLEGMTADNFSLDQVPTQQAVLDLSSSSLVGSRDRLELTVFAAADDAESPVEDSTSRGRPGSSPDSQDQPPRSPAKKVTYEFVAPQDDFDTQDDLLLDESLDQDPSDQARPRVGLWRREVFTSNRSRSIGSELGNQALTEAEDGFAAALTRPRSSSRRETEVSETSDTAPIEEFAPEIIDLQFDYFDGLKWHSSWDSQKRNRLPVLVRVRFAIETREQLREKKLEERAESAFSENARDLRDDESTALTAQGTVRAGTERQLAPNWDQQFILFVSTPEKPTAGTLNQPPSNRAAPRDRTQSRLNSRGRASE